MSKELPSAVVFDMDGVLIDATDWHYEALNRALEHLGLTITPKEHLGEFNGLPTRVKLDKLSEEKGLPVALHQIVSKVKQAETLRYAALNSVVRLETLRVLGFLRELGIPIAVATNSIRMTTDVMLTMAGLHQYFDLVVTNEDVSRPKPNPEIYETVCKRLQVDPSLTLVIEDTEVGAAAARAANCRVQKIRLPEDLTVDLLTRVMRTEKW